MSVPYVRAKHKWNALASAFLFWALGGCASAEYALAEPANYDGLVGRNFSASIFKGRQVYRVVRETNGIEELENIRSDGCILVFGVRKTDDTIEYWRVDSGEGSCLTRKQPLNR